MNPGNSGLEKAIGYKFSNAGLLECALIHTSYANEAKRDIKDNERLEFLGDAVLELSSSDFLYRNYPDMPEGEMTRLRSSLVCEPALAYDARQFGLQKYIMLGVGEEKTGGRNRDSIVSDAMEALIGAIYLDGGLKPAHSFIERFILNNIEKKTLFLDCKTMLQEKLVKNGDDLIEYEITGESGPDHNKTFVAEVKFNGNVIGRGEGKSKKDAQQHAAYSALNAINER